VGLGAFFYKKNRLISFGIFWFFLALAVESSILPIKDVIYEHRLYLPLIGLTIVLLAALYEVLNGAKLKYFVILNCAIILVFSYATFQRNFVWENELTLWTDVINKAPNKYRGYINRGLDNLRHFALDKAMVDLEKGLSLDPNNAIAYCNIGAIYGLKEEREKALECFTKAITLDPKYEEAYNNRGSIYFQLGQNQNAFADFNTAIKLKPKSPTGYNNRATLSFMLGNYEGALKDYYSALTNDYMSKDILKNIGLTYSKLGDYDKALEYYNKSLEIAPNNPFVLFNRAIVYYIIKKPELAKKDIQKMKSMGIEAEADFNSMVESLNLKY
jgi:tetratricopeptide (TPR) repeat protein